MESNGHIHSPQQWEKKVSQEFAERDGETVWVRNFMKNAENAMRIILRTRGSEVRRDVITVMKLMAHEILFIYYYNDPLEMVESSAVSDVQQNSRGPDL
jgi:hypothetical protein